ncbi:putative sporulation protein YtxC [Gracilibacillus massiliensis]|uniref:putative sporulation protein YtxC n=1 Tax=Gracilibacillus massiliensis TaxID=1564956 RepID=UPI00071CE985|nr:putative sporulation protein YtxC [Gracilibacillus massiliensis]
MLEVYFEQDTEANLFYQLLKQEKDKWNAVRKRVKRTLIQLNPVVEMDWEEEKRHLAPLLSLVFIQCRELAMIRHILRKKYYFSNEDEIERITSIARSLLEKDETVYEDRIHQHELRDILTTIFTLQIDESFVRFDSIIHFRLHHYVDQLTEMVGLAIDEFKREEEYQEFIHSIREFIKRKLPEEEVVHVVQGGSFQFYRDNGVQYTMEDLKDLKARFPLFIFGLEKEEWDISPLIMLAPSRIYLYGEDQSETRTHTIMTIFQERCSFYATDYFPFLLPDQKES